MSWVGALLDYDRFDFGMFIGVDTFCGGFECNINILSYKYLCQMFFFTFSNKILKYLNKFSFKKICLSIKTMRYSFIHIT